MICPPVPLQHIQTSIRRQAGVGESADISDSAKLCNPHRLGQAVQTPPLRGVATNGSRMKRLCAKAWHQLFGWRLTLRPRVRSIAGQDPTAMRLGQSLPARLGGEAKGELVSPRWVAETGELKVNFPVL